MPTYEYACKTCEEHLEVVQSFHDPAPTACPSCGGSLRKVFGSVGISFKGSGFYRNDARSGSAKRSGATKADGGAAKTEGSSAKPEGPKAASEPAAKSPASAPAA